MDIRPDFANVERDGKSRKSRARGCKNWDIIVIKPGEMVALDGEVVEGKSSLDTKALTGESLPRDLTEGEEILSGCINLNGVI